MCVCSGAVMYVFVCVCNGAVMCVCVWWCGDLCVCACVCVYLAVFVCLMEINGLPS